jgi:hypothetical protein
MVPMLSPVALNTSAPFTKFTEHLLSVLVYGFFRFFCQLDQVTRFEKDVSHDAAPDGRPPQQKLKIDPKMNELLLLSLAHDGTGFLILLYSQSLGISVNGFCFFDERLDHANIRTRLCRELLRGFMVLIKAHVYSSVH